MKKEIILEISVENRKKYLVYIALIVVLIFCASLFFGQRENSTQKVFPAPHDIGPYSDK